MAAPVASPSPPPADAAAAVGAWQPPDTPEFTALAAELGHENVEAYYRPLRDHETIEDQPIPSPESDRANPPHALSTPFDSLRFLLSPRCFTALLSWGGLWLFNSGQVGCA